MTDEIKQPPPMVYVVWEDATQKDTGTWVSVDKDKPHEYEPAIIQTVGFLLAATDKGIIVSSAWSPDCIAPRDQIPVGMIRKIVPLELGKPPRTRKRK